MTSSISKKQRLPVLQVVSRILCLLIPSCIVQPACFNDADCPDGKICSISEGVKEGECISRCATDQDCAGDLVCDGGTSRCTEPECLHDEDCPDGFECTLKTCRAMDQLVCPDDMVVVDKSFCIDIYEASRPDATSMSSGSDSSIATSRPGVLPWQVLDNQTAQVACESAGKGLCTATQWHRACSGPDETLYGYGDDYNPVTCNGIDTFCFCDETSEPGNECPYPHCYGDRGSAFRLEPTGSFEGCTNAFGVHDMNGNLWEHVAGGSDFTVRGGAFNCLDSERLHRCTYVPGTWAPSARGFRCCSPGELISPLDSDSNSTGETDK